MAKQMSFTTPDGVTHPNGYWVLARFEIRPIDQTAHITLYGYHDSTTKAALNAPDTQHDYDVPAASVPTYFPLGTSFDLQAQCFQYAMDTADPGTKQSYFTGAVDVL